VVPVTGQAAATVAVMAGMVEAVHPHAGHRPASQLDDAGQPVSESRLARSSDAIDSQPKWVSNVARSHQCGHLDEKAGPANPSALSLETDISLRRTDCQNGDELKDALLA
jgi:hypothetical protein